MNERQTVFSPCRQYRYTLWREWCVDSLTGCADDLQNHDRYAMFIGLNPSTADETKDDPTIRRCIGFAKRWGYGALCMTNLFAFRATDPRIMKGHTKPVGDENDRWITACAREAGIVVAAWGVNGEHMGRNIEVVKLIDNLQCLVATKQGHPKHPLYVSSNIEPQPYWAAQQMV